MKKFFVIFSIAIFMALSLTGCSSDSIKKIEVIDNTIKTNYIVGDTIEFDDFSLKLTLKNNEEKIYNITEDMVTINQIDNSIVGNQNVNMIIDYNGMKIEMVLTVKFDLPEEVKTIINLINELPNKESVNLSNENQIYNIENKYNLLNEEYKEYVNNYDAFATIKEEFDNLKNAFITPEFINERVILKSNLDNLFYSLNQEKYSKENWNNIIEIYDAAIKDLYLNENYSIVKNIANNAINQIKGIVTIDQYRIEQLRIIKKEALREYRYSLDYSSYSQNNNYALDSILNDFNTNVMMCNSTNEIEGLYNKTINDLNKVATIEEEKVSSLNFVKESKINELKEKFLE